MTNSDFCFAFAGSCDEVQCQRHKHCVQDQNGLPHCVHCVMHCPASRDERQLLCGADGVTYESTCQFRRATCLHGSSIGVAYTGRCRGQFYSKLFIFLFLAVMTLMYSERQVHIYLSGLQKTMSWCCPILFAKGMHSSN